MWSINQLWYKQNPLSFLLWPLSWLYRLVIAVRRTLYRYSFIKIHQLPVPVIIVGNLTVGGNGKTPLVIYLAQQLQQHGYHPGIISRGYKGKAQNFPQSVEFSSDPSLVGDEPVLMARHASCPIVVSPNRVAAAKYLLNNFYCNVIISDDGLQHYALARDIEMVVVDGERQFGNGMCLPVGPLREPVSRLNQVDFVIYNRQSPVALPLDFPEHTSGPLEFTMQLQSAEFVNLRDPNNKQLASYFLQRPLQAIAGIGNPQRFFATLHQLGLKPTEHIFPNHYAFTANDLHYPPNNEVLMTEKDAVKCIQFATTNCWYLPVEAQVEDAFMLHVLQYLRTIRNFDKGGVVA